MTTDSTNAVKFMHARTDALTTTRRYVYDADQEAMGLILPGASGVIWAHQAGGGAHWHRECEGTWVRLGATPSWLTKWFYDVHRFDGRFTEEVAIGIEEALSEDLGLDWVRLDRSKLKKSIEAWAFVLIDPNEHPDFSAYAGASAILTWKNSN